MKGWLAGLACAAIAAAGALDASGQTLATPRAGEPGHRHGDALNGQALAQRWCRQCHLLPGEHAATDAAPTFESIARDPSKTAAHLRGFLAKPHAPMPQIPLGGDEVEDLIAYIRSAAR